MYKKRAEIKLDRTVWKAKKKVCFKNEVVSIRINTKMKMKVEKRPFQLARGVLSDFKSTVLMIERTQSSLHDVKGQDKGSR